MSCLSEHDIENWLFDPDDHCYLDDIHNFLDASDRSEEDFRLYLADRGRHDLYFLSKYILGYDKLTSYLHAPLCRWLEARAYDFWALIYPGQHYKTTLLKSLLVRYLIRNPNERILLASATEDNPIRFNQEIQRHLESNEILRWLYPEILPDKMEGWSPWSKRETLIVRNQVKPEPSIMTCGVGVTITAMHVDRALLTDIIDREIAQSETKMANAIDWTGYLDRIVDKDGGTIGVEGNRWPSRNGTSDVMGFIIKNDCATFTDQSRGIERKGPGRFHILKRSAREAQSDGALLPIFKIYTNQWYDRLEKRFPDIYACQYQNEPSEQAGKDFKSEWLHYFEDDGERPIIDGKPSDWDWSAMMTYVRCDPAISKSARASRSAILVDSISPDRKIFVRESWAARTDPKSLIEKFFALFWKYHCIKSGIESAGLQDIQFWIADKARNEGINLRLQALSPRMRNKNTRIMAMQPYFASDMVYVDKSRNADFIYEYLGFSSCDAEQEAATKDVMDVFAYGPEMWGNIVTRRENFEDYAYYDSQRFATACPITGY